MPMDSKMKECWKKQINASIENLEKDIEIWKDQLATAQQSIDDAEEDLTLYRAELIRLETEN